MYIPTQREIEEAKTTSEERGTPSQTRRRERDKARDHPCSKDLCIAAKKKKKK